MVKRKYYIPRCKGLEGVPWYEACLKLRKRGEIEEVDQVKESEIFRANRILEANKRKFERQKERRQRLINQLHNLANNLKSGLIDWIEFDRRLEQIINNEVGEVK